MDPSEGYRRDDEIRDSVHRLYDEYLDLQVRLEQVLEAGYDIEIWHTKTDVPFHAKVTSTPNQIYGQGDSAAEALMDCIKEIEANKTW